MTTAAKLPLEAFKQIVENAPLFAIDLIVLDESQRVLVGKRLNRPAQGYWFVPGGRVYKGESLNQAFNRISVAELGRSMQLFQAELLGLYDHFYDDSFIDKRVSTHYINATHVIRVRSESLKLPKSQHSHYKWITLHDLSADPRVHKFSKIFLSNLKQWLKNND